MAVVLVAGGVALAGCAAAQSHSSSGSASTPATAETSATQSPASAAGDPAASGCQAQSGNYVGEAFCLLNEAGVRNQTINTDCGPLLTNGMSDPGGRCLSDIADYTAFLHAVQSDLHLGDLSAVPANVQEPAAWLNRAVDDELTAAQQATTAIDSQDLAGFLRAWGLHGKAGRELQAAGAVFAAH